MTKHKIILLFTLFNSLNVISVNPTKDSILLKQKGFLIISRINFIYEISVPGEIEITEEYLFFHPYKNVQYFKDVTIPLNNILSVQSQLSRSKIKTKDGNEYTIILYKNKQTFRQLINSHTDNSYKIPEKSGLNTIINKCEPGQLEVQCRINNLGSTLYSPLIISGCMEKNNNILTFTPVEYSNYLKKIEFDKTKITKIIKRGNHKVIIELDTIKYVFISPNREQFIRKNIENIK